MNPHFAYFIKSFGPAVDRRDVPPEAFMRFKGKLPEQLLRHWAEHGWSGYADGLFWMVNPEDYEPVLDAWLGHTPLAEEDALHIIARSAFGHLLIWGERSGFALRLFAPGAFVVRMNTVTQAKDLELAAQMFFSVQKRDVYEFDGRFLPAKQRHGRPGPNDMYGFVPALALGGSVDTGQIQKVKAIEHLVMLAQFGELQVMA